MTGDIGTIIRYFESMKDKVPAIKFFLYGGVELGLNYYAGSTEMKYPMLWFEQPNVNLSKTLQGQNIAEYSFGMNILTNCQDGQKHEIAATILTQNVAFDVIKQIKRDWRGGTIMEMDHNFNMDEIDRVWAANHIGWRVEFKVSFRMNTIVGA